MATFNTALNTCLDGQTSPCLPGGLVESLSDPAWDHGQQVAEILQRVRPDIVLLNEFNYDEAGTAAALFQQNFLSVGQNWTQQADGPVDAIEYPYVFFAPSNTGIHSGHDLNNDGVIDSTVGSAAYANDSLGFGEFPGRYGMLVLSRFPIVQDEVRTLQNFLWRDMPEALLPDNPATPEPGDWYSPEELAILPLSSKSHWDVPIRVGDQTIHLLASHPTPPVFDGPEDRNGRRNFDEIRLWADYVDPTKSDYLIDDAGQRGGLNADASFVIVGDLNADPMRGDGVPGAVNQLLDHPRVNSSVIPMGPAGDITSDFNLRVDYVLPSSDLQVSQAGMFYPPVRDPLRPLLRASDHRLVWLDLVNVPEPSSLPMVLTALTLLSALRRRIRESSSI